MQLEPNFLFFFLLSITTSSRQYLITLHYKNLSSPAPFILFLLRLVQTVPCHIVTYLFLLSFSFLFNFLAIPTFHLFVPSPSLSVTATSHFPHEDTHCSRYLSLLKSYKNCLELPTTDFLNDRVAWLILAVLSRKMSKIAFLVKSGRHRFRNFSASKVIY